MTATDLSTDPITDPITVPSIDPMTVPSIDPSTETAVAERKADRMVPQDIRQRHAGR